MGKTENLFCDEMVFFEENYINLSRLKYIDFQ